MEGKELDFEAGFDHLCPRSSCSSLPISPGQRLLLQALTPENESSWTIIAFCEIILVLPPRNAVKVRVMSLSPAQVCMSCCLGFPYLFFYIFLFPYTSLFDWSFSLFFGDCICLFSSCFTCPLEVG